MRPIFTRLSGPSPKMNILPPWFCPAGYFPAYFPAEHFPAPFKLDHRRHSGSHIGKDFSFCACCSAFSGFPTDRITPRTANSCTYSNGQMLRILTGFPNQPHLPRRQSGRHDAAYSFFIRKADHFAKGDYDKSLLKFCQYNTPI